MHLNYGRGSAIFGIPDSSSRKHSFRDEFIHLQALILGNMLLI